MERKPDISLLPADGSEIQNNEAMTAVSVVAIGPEQLKKFTKVLQEYNAGLSQTKNRIISNENWWKLRNSIEEQKVSSIGKDGGFQSVSGWLHNVIVSKHADAMESFPEPNILPREKDDKEEAEKLTAIVPCVLEQNRFEKTYSTAMWQKFKFGTGIYKVVWDSGKLNGLGDIGIECCNPLNLYWEPGITDIQQSRYFFHTELQDKDLLQQRYPDKLKDKLKGSGFMSAKFLYDDTVNTSNKVTVIEVYYHKIVNGKMTVQYCKYVQDVVLFASENETKTLENGLTGNRKSSMAETGLYDHGRFPYVFDPLFPIEGSPCGYGYVDICRNPQTEIDLMKTSFIKNAMVGATPRYFRRADGGVNEEQFLDLSNPLVEVTGSLDEAALRQIGFNALDGVYVNVLDRTIQELRETSGNTETSTGSISSGVTAASAIAALQEASGKGSRDSTQAAYRVFSEVVDLCIELIRQFYDIPRQFRIVGKYGMEDYVSYTSAGIQPQHQGNDFGQDMGYRLPVFDIKISAQKKNVYTKISQNELATQFFHMGFFNPQMTDQALMCLDMMDFDGKDQIMQKVAQNGTMFQKLIQYMQMSLMLAQTAAPHMVQGLSQDIIQTMGVGSRPGAVVAAQPIQADHIDGLSRKEPTLVENARERSEAASQPEGGRVIKKKEDK